MAPHFLCVRIRKPFGAAGSLPKQPVFFRKNRADPKHIRVLGQPDFFERFIYGSFADPPQGSITTVLFFLAVFSQDELPSGREFG
ncbi:hypothetical protein [Geobacillus kaustophilus]|uniref:hypothetical protein n=1 Tax=Geobacillus kaustophilus TaxID=1462 RepID=UPI0005CCC458|nr:hypothetical protein [Geobacillus kaustophilus]